MASTGHIIVYWTIQVDASYTNATPKRLLEKKSNCRENLLESKAQQPWAQLICSLFRLSVLTGTANNTANAASSAQSEAYINNLPGQLCSVVRDPWPTSAAYCVPLRRLRQFSTSFCEDGAKKSATLWCFNGLRYSFAFQLNYYFFCFFPSGDGITQKCTFII